MLESLFNFRKQIEQYLSDLAGIQGLGAVVIGVLAVLVTTVVFVVLYKITKRLLTRLESFARDRSLKARPLRFQSQEILSVKDIARVTGGAVQGMRIVALFILFLIYLNAVFSLFPSTREWVARLLAYLLDLLSGMVQAFVDYIPSLIIVIAILLSVRYLLRLGSLVFRGIESGRITVSGFYPEWAQPTFNILRLLIAAFTLVVIFPYLPGSGSPAFQGVSIFVGVLFSLGSTAAVSNVVAGVVLTYTRAFRLGDLVRIADAEGKVVEKSLFITRVRTPKQVDIAIPNSMVLSNHIVNFSARADKGGLVLHTAVTIGYDAPWQKVHELLVEAARRTAKVESEPEPFVLQKSLDDFYVAYELNAYTTDPDSIPGTYSEMHRHIQDTFAEAGLEIMSPHFSAVRDGHPINIPDDYLPKDYEPPAFRVHPLEKLFKRPKGD